MPRYHFCSPIVPIILVGLLATTAVGSQAGEWPTGPALDYGVETAGVSRGDASVDTGGDVSRDSLLFKFSANRNWNSQLTTGLSLGYIEDSYAFHGVTAFADSQPWSDIHSLRLSLPVMYRGGDNWNIFIIPSLRFSADKDADLNDGQETGVIVAAGYRVSESLTLGPGIGYFTEMGGGTNLFPIVVVNWKITDTISIETGRGLAASQGPGITIRWRPTDDWTYSLIARYEKKRFRLSDDGDTPSGIGQEKSIPLALGIKYAFGPKVDFSVLLGTHFAGQLQLEDKHGNDIADAEFDSAPFVGGIFSVSF